MNIVTYKLSCFNNFPYIGYTKPELLNGSRKHAILAKSKVGKSKHRFDFYSSAVLDNAVDLGIVVCPRTNTKSKQ